MASTTTTAKAALRTAALLVRRPLITDAPTPFAAAYYDYHAGLRASHSRTVVPDFWTKKGATGGNDDARGIQRAEPAPRETDADAANDVKALHRKLDQSLLLVVKRARNDKLWALPTTDVAPEEPLHEAARRSITSSLGSNLEFWMVGRVPVGLAQSSDASSKTFYHKAQILAGQVQTAEAAAKGNDAVADFAWVTKQELPAYLGEEAARDVAELL
ncbi:hypothetical protein BC828DRAFT_398029 [Blastocladiella britannica]|nr:hypothetical protein BC828DRAFT_398029 [Blastocladiella britannica]